MIDERSVQSGLRNYLDTIYVSSEKEVSTLLQNAKEWSEKLGHPQMSISSIEGRLLSFLVRSFSCHKFVEVGTFTGYSALWILKGMSSGILYTLEKDKEHFDSAQVVLSQWSGPAQVQSVHGDAQEQLKKLSLHRPFDGIFIDADKSSYPKYLDWAEENLKKGGLIIADNTLLDGLVYDDQAQTSFSQSQKKAMREFNQRLANSQKFMSMILPTHAGLSVAIKC